MNNIQKRFLLFLFGFITTRLSFVYISNNIKFVIAVSMDYNSVLNIKKLAEIYPSILESAGLHPSIYNNY